MNHPDCIMLRPVNTYSNDMIIISFFTKIYPLLCTVFLNNLYFIDPYIRIHLNLRT